MTETTARKIAILSLFVTLLLMKASLVANMNPGEILSCLFVN